eukprot:7101063-Ditylum_brightwellii.AAC.1
MLSCEFAKSNAFDNASTLTRPASGTYQQQFQVLFLLAAWIAFHVDPLQSGQRGIANVLARATMMEVPRR